MPKKIVIIGGGISGLAAANRLKELTSIEDAEITLLEAGGRWGGVIETMPGPNGLVLEQGPESFISDKPWAIELAKRLGCELIGTNSSNRRSFILKNGQLIRIPEGFYLLAPTILSTFLFTPLISLGGKLRALCDLFIPKKGGDEDESLANFTRRRLGSEALDSIAQPMAGGIYTADPELLSMRAALPRFVEMEKSHGSLIRALKARAQAKSAEGQASGPRYSLFLSLKNGMQDLTDTLVGRLAGVEKRINSPVEKIEKGPHHWRVQLVGGHQITADHVIIAVPAYQAARIVQPVSETLSGLLETIPYESVATVNVLFDEKDLPRPLDGFGFVVPADQKRKIVACTFMSVKFPNRAPEGKVLLRVFVGGAMNKGLLELNDEGIVKIAREELGSILGIKNEPEQVTVKRYDQAMPQYHVGHLDKVAAIERETKNFSGLHLIGNAYRGVGIPDCIFYAERAAEEIANQIYMK